jgi:hypothetical protein
MRSSLLIMPLTRAGDELPDGAVLVESFGLLVLSWALKPMLLVALVCELGQGKVLGWSSVLLSAFAMLILRGSWLCTAAALMGG